MTYGVMGRKKAWNFAVVETGNLCGNMNDNSEFYPEIMTKDEIDNDFLMRRIELGKEFGFDGRRMFIAHQTTKDGSYKIIDKEIVESVDDGWKLDIKEDILIVTTDTPEIVIGHQVADYPVVMMRDVKKGITAIGHCSAEMIDKKLPMMIADAMTASFGTNEEDIYAYVSACASEDSLIYNCYPTWATDETVWKDSIIEKEKMYYINLRNSIANQLLERGVTKYCMNPNDTITNSSYYSHNEVFSGNIEKEGYNFAGAYYKKKL